MSYFSTLLADAYGRAGDPLAGLAAIGRAQEFATRTHERYYASETLRTKGDLMRAAGAGGADVRAALEKR